MSMYDVRFKQEVIDKITFGDEIVGTSVGTHMIRMDHRDYGVYIHEDNRTKGSGHYIGIESKERALNLIKALEKAIELEWVV